MIEDEGLLMTVRCPMAGADLAPMSSGLMSNILSPCVLRRLPLSSSVFSAGRVTEKREKRERKKERKRMILFLRSSCFSCCVGVQKEESACLGITDMTDSEQLENSGTSRGLSLLLPVL